MQTDQQILNKLEKIERDVKEIRKHIIDLDRVMTEDDYKALIEYRKEKENGKLISHKQLKKELGL